MAVQTKYAQSYKASSTPTRRTPTRAFFQFSLKPTAINERRLYKPSEMVQMGPFKSAPMGFGTWSWGNKLLWDYDESRDSELQQVFNLMVSSGINVFDTGDSYGTPKLIGGSGEGRSELLLGKFTREYPGSEAFRKDIRIATKLAAYPWRLAPSQWVAACKASVKRVGQDKLALGQLHWSTANYAPVQERLMWDGLVAIYEAGLVEAVGVSNYGPKQLQKIHSYLSKRGVPLASAQVQFSLLSRGPDQIATKAACDDLGIALIAYSPLALGALTGKYSMEDPSSLPGGPRGLLFKEMLPGLTPLTTVLDQIAANKKKTPSQVAINWCMAKGAIPIPGAKSLNQAKENLGALGWRLSAGEVAALEEAADRVPRQMQQNVFQTK